MVSHYSIILLAAIYVSCHMAELAGQQADIISCDVNPKILFSLLFAISFVLLPAAATEGVT